MNAKQLVGTVIETIIKIVVVVAVVMLTYKYATSAFDFGYRVFAEEPVSSEETAKIISIAITEDAKPMDIGKVLEEKGLIEDAKLFYAQEMLSGYHGKIKPGIYELSSSMTSEEMMAVMAADLVEGEDNLEDTSDTEQEGAADETVADDTADEQEDAVDETAAE